MQHTLGAADRSAILCALSHCAALQHRRLHRRVLAERAVQGNQSFSHRIEFQDLNLT